jgi:hypoxanthine phosphoribosyltransferase
MLDKYDPNVIVGIARGGLVPGLMMSHWMNKPFKPIIAALRDFPEWEDYLPRKTDSRVLIVDDICDSGATFDKLEKGLKARSKELDRNLEVRFATLWWNNECEYEPYYYVQELAKDSTNTWIFFPWENWWNHPN